MGESASLRSLSTFVFGTLPPGSMWTDHDPGWHLLPGIDVQSSAKWTLPFTRCRALGESRLVIVAGHES